MLYQIVVWFMYIDWNTYYNFFFFFEDNKDDSFHEKCYNHDACYEYDDNIDELFNLAEYLIEISRTRSKRHRKVRCLYTKTNPYYITMWLNNWIFLE